MCSSSLPLDLGPVFVMLPTFTTGASGAGGRGPKQAAACWIMCPKRAGLFYRRAATRRAAARGPLSGRASAAASERRLGGGSPWSCSLYEMYRDAAGNDKLGFGEGKEEAGRVPPLAVAEGAERRPKVEAERHVVGVGGESAAERIESAESEQAFKRTPATRLAYQSPRNR